METSKGDGIMSLPTPNYVLMDDHIIYKDSTSIALAAGSFARPISWCYLPDHIKEQEDKKGFYDKMNPEKDVYCYTRLGMILIPWSKLRKV